MARVPRPFEDNYGVNLAVAIFAIAPYILVTTAFVLFTNDLIAQFNVERTGLEIVSGLSTAGYAFGALLGGDIIRRFVQRTLFFICEAMFVAGCALAASAQGIVQFGAGSVLFGFATGLLLIIALPPVVQRHPASRMPNTAAFINIGFFGAVCAGPLVGGAVAQLHAWRWLYAGLAAFGVMTLIVSSLALPTIEPKAPDAKFDWHAIVLGFLATTLPFWATGDLAGHGFHSLLFMVPLAVGVAALVAMLLTQFHKEEPLAPVKPMWSTLPLAGLVVATIGGGAMVTLMELMEESQMMVLQRSPFVAGISFWPEVLGVLIAAFVLARIIRKRSLMIMPLAGMLLLIAAALLIGLLPADGPWAWVLIIAALLGLGAGATVSPGLWLAAFSLPSNLVGRTFALVELVRSDGDFILAPVILQIAQVSSVAIPMTMNGVHFGAWITLWVTLASTIVIVLLFVAGGSPYKAPDLETWLEKQDRPALESPPLGAALKARRTPMRIP